MRQPYSENGETFLKIVAEEMSVQQLVDLLKVKGEHGDTPLHLATYSKNGEAFLRVVAEKLPKDQLISLLNVKNN
jgi:hypothetical protein